MEGAGVYPVLASYVSTVLRATAVDDYAENSGNVRTRLKENRESRT